MANVNLRDPGQAGLLLLGVVLLVMTPICVSMAAFHAGMPLAAVAFPVVVATVGVLVTRIARKAVPPAQGTDP